MGERSVTLASSGGGSPDYAQLKVYDCGSWVWHLHDNQSYLGRMILRLHRNETGSLSTCTSAEWNSLQQNIRLYDKVLCALFSPDRFNYSQMGNIYHQLHVQAVPRYVSKREWKNKEFVDENWGAN